jgi:8-oxo-dGTP pyrophosphatase MutT (NUDIX family)
MKFKNRPNEEVKLVDGRTAWLSRSPASICIILGVCNEKIFVLVEKRSPIMDEGNKYCVVSGYMDFNETSWETCIRETYEETGLNLLKYKFLNKDYKNPFFVNTDPSENRQNIALCHCVIINFNKLPKEVELFKNREIVKVKWINVNMLKQYDFAFNHDKRIYQALEYNHRILSNFYPK